MPAVTLASFLIALAGALLVTPAARTLAIRIDRQIRPYHVGTPLMRVPCLGGLGIYTALAASGVYLAGAGDWLSTGEQHQLLGLLLGGGIVLAAGIYSDLRRPELGWRFAWAILAAGVAVSYNTKLILSLTPAVAIVVAVAVLVITPSAMKLGNRGQGLIVGISAIAAACLGLLSWLVGSHLGIGLAAACIGAALGFLRYHYQPAQAALGDGGSSLLGFVLAGLSVIVVSQSPAGLAWLGTIAVLAVPLAEAGIRVVRGLRTAALRSRSTIMARLRAVDR